MLGTTKKTEAETAFYKTNNVVCKYFLYIYGNTLYTHFRMTSLDHDNVDYFGNDVTVQRIICIGKFTNVDNKKVTHEKYLVTK